MIVGDELSVRVERLEKSGRAVALETREDTAAAPAPRQEVRIEGLLPGERATVVVEHVGKRGVAFAKVVTIDDPVDERRPPPCRHHGTCNGCPLSIADEAWIADLKREQLRTLGLPVDRVVRDERTAGYRWSSKRVLRNEEGVWVAGSYRRGTHELASMRGCPVDHPDISRCFDELTDAATRLGTCGLRYAWAKTDGSGSVLLTLVAADSEPATQAGLDDLAAALSYAAGVAACVQEGEGNAMRGHSLRHIRGLSQLEITLCDASVAVGPMGFLQPNPPIAALAYADLVGDGSGTTALDLYAGAGITTSMLRTRFANVRACESSAESAAALGIEAQSAATFLAAEQQRDDGPALIVANPPRAGLGDDVCDALIALARRHDHDLRLHIMSCEPRALLRDIERLTADGTFVLERARAYDTLPQTAHIEVVAWLAHKKSRADNAPR